jgi:hypothetical protein
LDVDAPVVTFVFREASPRVMSMSDPLPADIDARLRSDSTAALAASLILAGSFPDIVSWALRACGANESKPKASIPAEGDGKTRHVPQRQPADKLDQGLLALMRANPRASLADLIRPRGSRARRASQQGCVQPVDQAPPPKAAWIKPLSGTHVARHAADGRVRDEMTMA